MAPKNGRAASRIKCLIALLCNSVSLIVASILQHELPPKNRHGSQHEALRKELQAPVAGGSRAGGPRIPKWGNVSRQIEKLGAKRLLHFFGETRDRDEPDAIELRQSRICREYLGWSTMRSSMNS